MIIKWMVYWNSRSTAIIRASYTNWYYLNTIRFYPARVINNLYTGIYCPRESSPEFGMCFIIRQDLSDPVHLNYKGYRTTETCLRCLHKFIEVLHAPLRRRIRKKSYLPSLQICCKGTALHFDNVLFSTLFHIKVKSGFPVSILRFYQVIILDFQILFYQDVGNQTVNVDPFKSQFININ